MVSEVGRSIPIDYVPSTNTINTINEKVHDIVAARYRENPETFFTQPDANIAYLKLWTRHEYIQHFNQACRIEDSNKSKVKMILAGLIISVIAVLAFSSWAISLAVAAFLSIVYCYVGPRMVEDENQSLQPLAQEIMYCTQRVWNEGITDANWPPTIGNVPAQIKDTSISLQQINWREYGQRFQKHHFEENMKNLLFTMASGNWSDERVRRYVDWLPNLAI